MFSLDGSLQLPHGILVLLLHHDSQLFTGGNMVAKTSRSCIAVYCAVQGSCAGLDLCELEIISELIETCT